MVKQARTCNLNEYFVGAKRWWLTKATMMTTTTTKSRFQKREALLIDDSGEGEEEADDGCEEGRWRWRWKRRIMRTRRESGSEAIVRGVEACLRCDN